MFGFLLGIDLKGMGGGASGRDEDGDDRMGSNKPTPTAARANVPNPAQKEEEEVRVIQFAQVCPHQCHPSR